MTPIRLEPDHIVEPGIKVHRGAGHSLHLSGSTSPRGGRFLISFDGDVEIYCGTHCVGKFRWDPYDDLEIHLTEEWLVATNGSPGIIRFLDFEGVEFNQIAIPWGEGLA